MHYSGVFSSAAFTLDNFAAIFRDAPTVRAIANTLILVVVCSTLSATIGAAVGYVLQTKRVPFPWLIEAAILVPFALPGLDLRPSPRCGRSSTFRAPMGRSPA